MLININQPQITSNEDQNFKKDACFYSLLSLDDGAAGDADRSVSASSRRNQDDWESGQNPESTLAPAAHRDSKVRNGCRSGHRAHHFRCPRVLMLVVAAALRRRRRQVWIWFRDAVTRRSRDRTLLVPAEYTDYEFAVQCTRTTTHTQHTPLLLQPYARSTFRFAEHTLQERGHGASDRRMRP